MVHRISLPALVMVTVTGWGLTAFLWTTPSTASSTTRPLPPRQVAPAANVVPEREAPRSRPQWDISIGRGYVLHTTSCATSHGEPTRYFRRTGATHHHESCDAAQRSEPQSI